MASGPDSPDPAPSWHRFLWLAIAAGSALILAIAAGLEPDPRGHGTHTQLGFPPCGFLLLTGSPCPGCGLTTAFAHGIRGHWVSAAVANPLGLALFLVVCASLPFSVVAACRSWSVDAVIERFALNRWALALAVGAASLWVLRFAEAL